MLKTWVPQGLRMHLRSRHCPPSLFPVKPPQTHGIQRHLAVLHLSTGARTAGMLLLPPSTGEAPFQLRFLCKYLTTYHIPGTVLGPRDVTVNQTGL